MTEPTYEYVKGVGWVPSFHLWLKGHEIRVGDVLDMYRLSPTSPEGNFWNGFGVVKRVLETSSGGCYSGTEGTLYYNRNETLEWHVIKRA